MLILLHNGGQMGRALFGCQVRSFRLDLRDHPIHLRVEVAEVCQHLAGDSLDELLCLQVELFGLVVAKLREQEAGGQAHEERYFVQELRVFRLARLLLTHGFVLLHFSQVVQILIMQLPELA